MIKETMTPEQLEKFLHHEIPTSIALGVKVISTSENEVVLEAPLDPNHNHMGTAFGGSLSTLLILASYTWLYQALAGEGQVHVILKENQASFIMPVRENIRSICQAPSEESFQEFLKIFRRKGLARIKLTSFIEIAEGEAARMEGEFVAQKVSPSSNS
ncbi:MAG: YiiD C-terminal domain-containing protein [Bdellovibrionota bacterium]